MILTEPLGWNAVLSSSWSIDLIILLVLVRWGFYLDESCRRQGPFVHDWDVVCRCLEQGEPARC